MPISFFSRSTRGRLVSRAFLRASLNGSVKKMVKHHSADIMEESSHKGLFGKPVANSISHSLTTERTGKGVFPESLPRQKVILPGFIEHLNLALYTISRACMGLDYAHQKRGTGNETLDIIHRDISLQNILVSYEGEVKLVDFGIAKAAFQSAETKSGVFKGKIPYMSPEQVMGGPIDRRSDIFSLGIVLYELLTGQRLFQGRSEFEIIEKVKTCQITGPLPTHGHDS